MGEFAQCSYLTGTTTGASAKVGPQTPPGARVKYTGATVSLVAGTNGTVRIHRDGVATGQVIDSFTVNYSNFSTAQHFFEPGIDAGTGIFVEIVGITGTLDICTYWR